MTITLIISTRMIDSPNIVHPNAKQRSSTERSNPYTAIKVPTTQVKRTDRIKSREGMEPQKKLAARAEKIMNPVTSKRYNQMKLRVAEPHSFTREMPSSRPCVRSSEKKKARVSALWMKLK